MYWIDDKKSHLKRVLRAWELQISDFKFSKVMQQHTKGVMGILLSVLLEIFCSLQQWKNFANLSTIDKIIAKINRVSAFLDHPVYSAGRPSRWALAQISSTVFFGLAKYSTY